MAWGWMQSKNLQPFYKSKHGRRGNHNVPASSITTNEFLFPPSCLDRQYSFIQTCNEFIEFEHLF